MNLVSINFGRDLDKLAYVIPIGEKFFISDLSGHVITSRNRFDSIN